MKVVFDESRVQFIDWILCQSRTFYHGKTVDFP